MLIVVWIYEARNRSSTMSESEHTETVGEGAISGNQASIPATIRERADIEDGDRVRWRWYDGELSVEIVRQRKVCSRSSRDSTARAKPSITTAQASIPPVSTMRVTRRSVVQHALVDTNVLYGALQKRDQFHEEDSRS